MLSKRAAGRRRHPPAFGETIMRQQAMQTTVERVTPQQAQTWLEKNYEKNRPLREGWAEELAARIRRGHWKLSHQSIAFDTEGKLLDGQHRLWAIVMAGAAVELYVTRNAPRESFAVLDGHRVRTVSEQAGDSWITPRVVASARAMLRGPLQSHVGEVDDRDPTLLIAFIRDNQETIERVHALLPTDRRARGRSNLTQVVMGALYRASLHVSLKKLQRFVDVYVSGLVASPGESAAILLRDWMNSEAKKDRTVIYQKTQRAIAAFMDDDPIATLYAASDDLYPLGAPRVTPQTKGKKMTRAEREYRRGQRSRQRKAGTLLRRVK